MLRDSATNHILEKIAKDLSKLYNIEITVDTVHLIVDFQYKMIRNCIRGGLPITLKNLGTFHLMKSEGESRNAKIVQEFGGYEHALKLYEVKGDVADDEVLYNPDYFSGREDCFIKVPRKKIKRKKSGKRSGIFHTVFTQKRAPQKLGQGGNDSGNGQGG